MLGSTKQTSREPQVEERKAAKPRRTKNQSIKKKNKRKASVARLSAIG